MKLNKEVDLKKNVNSNLIIITLLILLTIIDVFAEHPTVTTYVQLGLSNNNNVRQSLRKEEAAIASHKEAMGNYLPQISIESRYSRSEGGRSMELPLGDLLNPVYSALGFPEEYMVENQNIELMPKEEIEAKLRVIQPLFNPSVHFSALINKEKMILQKEITTSTKTIIAEGIRKAYYSWILSVEAGKVYELSLKQAEKQLDVTNHLRDAGMLTADAVYSMQSDVYSAQQAITENKNIERSVRRQVNQLLNKSLDSDLIYLSPDSLMASLINIKTQPEISKNSKIKILESSYNLHTLVNKHEKLKTLPTLSFALETGLLSDDFKIKNNGFLIGSIVLNWEIFTGLKRYNKIKQTKLERVSSKLKLDEELLENERIIKNSFDSFQTAITALIPAQKIVETSEHYYSRVLKSYESGSKTVSELSEAHLKLNKAKLNFKKMQIDILIAHSSLLASLDKSIE